MYCSCSMHIIKQSSGNNLTELCKPELKSFIRHKKEWVQVLIPDIFLIDLTWRAKGAINRHTL